MCENVIAMKSISTNANIAGPHQPLVPFFNLLCQIKYVCM